MYNRRRKKTIQTELKFVEFDVPMGTRLRADNRWVRLSELIPWNEFEQEYASNFNDQGNEAFPFQVAMGSLIVKEQLRLPDRETVEAITENPYIQFFLGYRTFLEDAPFDPSLMVHFRKRIPKDLLLRMNERIALGLRKSNDARDKTEDGKNQDEGPNDAGPSGKLIIDATCAPEDMKYPTDVGLLNDAREITERVIDILWDKLPAGKKLGIKKPRTYRLKARQAFLNVIRQKKPRYSVVRKGIRKQINYCVRNHETVKRLVIKGASLQNIDSTLYRKLLVASEVLRQQRELLRLPKNAIRHIDDRIVSISKPHVRPIVRGKASAAVEFGAKISASVIGGMFFLDRHSWDSYNECNDLQQQAERFKERTGHYPESIHADKIYQTRENRAWCKKENIRLSGPKLGRPIEDIEILRTQQKQQRQDEIDRIEIEGKFGVGKRRFSLDRIMMKLRATSEHAAALIFIMINLNKILRDLLLSIFKMLVENLFLRIFCFNRLKMAF
jgi:hypothetical protein